MMRLAKYIVIFTISVYCITEAYSQENSFLRVIGRVEYQMKPLSGAVVKLYEKSAVTETVTTGTDGSFTFKLEMNSQYKVEVTKGGLISKSIEFYTEIPADHYGKWTTEFAMSLFQPCKGVDASALNNPVDRVKYNVNKREFMSDEGYVDKMRSQIQRVMIDIENCQINEFQNLVNEGNKDTKEKNYEEARAKYEAALEIFPDDKTVMKKLEELDEKASKDQNIEQLYKSTIQQADALLAQKQYEQAKQKYEGASRLKPGDSYSRQKVEEIDRQLAQQQTEQQNKVQQDAKYNTLIAQANSAYASANYRTAKQLYEEALLIKPNEAYPKQQVNKIQPLIQKQQSDQQEKEKATKEYNMAISQADRLLQEKKYEEAKQQYLAASVIKPDQSYPRTKVDAINKLIEEARKNELNAQKAERDKLINQYLDEADNYFAAKDYMNAKTSYEKVLQLDPNDQYSKQRVNKISSLIAQAEQEKLEQKETNYKQAVSQGDSYLASKQFEQAIAQYNKALTIKPQDANALAKIRQAENLKAENERNVLAQKEKDKKYQDLMASGNTYLQQKNYDVAKQKFLEASELIPSESLPRTKLNEINQLIAREQQNKLKQQELDNKYNNYIQLADNYYRSKNYDQAKLQYNNALGLKPDESYPKNQLSQIETVLLAQRKADEEQRLKQEAQERKYNELITQADSYFRSKNYEQAKVSYTEALGIKPAETYPKSQLSQINSIIAGNQRLAEAEKQKQAELNGKYDNNIRLADSYFNSKKYDLAKAEYNKALALKPGEVYPQNQLKQIENLIAQQNQMEEEKRLKEEQYNQLIALADKNFTDKQYELAKQNYEKALQIKPGASHPKVQLSRTMELLKQQEDEKRKKEALETKYKELIAQADKAFDANNYDVAKGSYEKALQIKPGETYPTERIRKIQDIQRILAANQNASKTSSTTAVKPGGSKPKLIDMKTMNVSEKQKYLNSLKNKYPEGVTLEVYKEGNQTTNRYVVIRNNEVNEFREDRFTWGGVDYYMNGKPVTSQYFDSQIKPREGEKFEKINM